MSHGKSLWRWILNWVLKEIIVKYWGTGGRRAFQKRSTQAKAWRLCETCPHTLKSGDLVLPFGNHSDHWFLWKYDNRKNSEQVWEITENICIVSKWLPSRILSMTKQTQQWRNLAGTTSTKWSKLNRLGRLWEKWTSCTSWYDALGRTQHDVCAIPTKNAPITETTQEETVGKSHWTYSIK